LTAYRKTTFVAATPAGRLELRVGKSCPALDSLLADLNVRSWGYITAFNPRSQPLPDAENETRHQRLEQRVGDLGVPAFRGEGIADDGVWPAERSLLLLGVSRSQVIELGREFGQLAVVFGEIGSPAELIEV